MADLLVIDDFAGGGLVSRLGTRWAATSDQVMGGVSRASLTVQPEGSRHWLRLTGRVSLENQGGFIQMGIDLAPGGGPVDLSGWLGVRLVVRGNGERYGCHLRTTACQRPWQSYRAEFVAPRKAATVELPFAGFTPHRIDAPLAPAALRRLGLVAIGRAFDADLAVAEVAVYR